MAPIKFGVLMIEFQTLDVSGPLDILSSCSKKLIAGVEAFLGPESAGLTEKAIDIEFYHINDTMDPVKMTADVNILPSTTCDTCPPLDYLLVGGPDPVTFNLKPRFAAFLRAHVEAGKGLFTTCTGAFAVASSGVLDGKSATVNHMCIDYCRQLFPKVNWTKESQWVVDGEIWTAGGACAGMEQVPFLFTTLHQDLELDRDDLRVVPSENMIAHWVIENYGTEVAKVGFETLDFQPRGADRKLLAQIV